MESFPYPLEALAMSQFCIRFPCRPVLNTIEEHEIHLGIVFQWLWDQHLFLSNTKVDLYLKRLYRMPQSYNRWLRNTDKIQHICEWRHPRTFNDFQCFLGLVQYLAHYMPDISAYTTPLLGCVRNSHPFEWTPLLDKCFESIKALACRAPILKPINNNNPNPIWFITNGSKAGRSRSHLWSRPSLEDMFTSQVPIQKVQ